MTHQVNTNLERRADADQVRIRPGMTAWIRAHYGIIAADVERVDGSIALVVIGPPYRKISVNKQWLHRTWDEADAANPPSLNRCPVATAEGGAE